jgi:hypothetical protein
MENSSVVRVERRPPCQGKLLAKHYERFRDKGYMTCLFTQSLFVVVVAVFTQKKHSPSSLVLILVLKYKNMTFLDYYSCVLVEVHLVFAFQRAVLYFE